MNGTAGQVPGTVNIDLEIVAERQISAAHNMERLLWIGSLTTKTVDNQLLFTDIYIY